MNVFKMNQRAFPSGEPPQAGVAAGGSENSNAFKLRSNRVGRAKGDGSLPLRRGAFRIPKKPSNAAIFLVSFLTYLIGIFPSMVFALPSNPTVQAGSATIDEVSSELMIINQSTQKAIIDWQEFGIGSAKHVDFQLSLGGVTLNRVTGNNLSEIHGKMTSNGDVWLINPNGILFGSSAQVDVHGLLATTSDISNTDFMNGNYNFSVPSSLSATIVNQGRITAAEGGLVALVAPGVLNSGIITARLGKVSLVSGTTFTVDLYGDQLINLGVDSKVMGQVTGMDGEVLTSLVSNSGSIFADGGVVRLDVNAAQGIVDRVINMDGVIQARSVSEQNGTIILMGGDAGEVSVSGTLDASGYGEGETGGTVHVLGEMLDFSGNGLIDVSGDLGGGTLLFGGDYQGQGSVPNATDVFVGPDTQTFADAVTSGNGGKLIFWADRRMRFYGIVKGRGGQYFGDGGFVEVSGKEELFFDGSVDTTAANGKTGTLLLDPDNIIIANGSGSSTADSGAVTFTIYETTLESLSATTNIILLATTSIVMQDLSDNLLNLQQGSGTSVTFKVTNGSISFSNTLDTISTQGGNIIFDASGDLTLGNVTSNGGDILLTGSDFTIGASSLLTAGAGDISITGAEAVEIGFGDSATCSGTCDMLITSTELGKMSGNKLIINGSAKNGAIYVDGVTQTTSTFTGGVELKDAHISGSQGGIFFEGSTSTFSTLSASAVDGIEVNASLVTTVGALTLDGDSDNGQNSGTSTDDIKIASGATLTSAGNISLSATTGGIIAAGALTLTAPSSITLTAPSSITLTGNLTAAGAVNLTANSGITLNGDITTSSGDLIIDANSSTLSLASGVALNSAGTLALTGSTISSLGALTLTSTGTTSINSALTSTGAVAMTANGLTLSNSTLSAAGNINLQGGSSGLSLVSGMAITSSAGDITLGASGGSITAAGSLTMNATNGVTVSNSLTTTGAVNINADTDDDGSGDFTISSGTLSTTSNALTVTASDFNLLGSINASATTINVSTGVALGLGSPTSFTGMDISATELGLITDDLNLINDTITVGLGAVAVSGKSTLGQTNGTITGQGAMTLSATNGLVINSKTISSAGNMTLGNGGGTDASISLASGAVLTATGGSITLNATTAGNMTLGNGGGTDASISLASGAVLTATGGSITLNATTGGTSAAGAVTFNADGININDSFTSAGATTFDAGTGTFTLAADKTLNTTSNSLSITTDNMVLGNNSSLIIAGATTLLTSTAVDIELGGTNIAGGFYLTDSELGQITASSLTIGGATNGDITVDGVTSVTEPLTLIANSGASAVNFLSTASSFGNLTVDAGTGGVSFGVGTSAADLSVTSGGSITATGVLSMTGTSSFDATNGITLSENFTSAGATIFDAGTGTFTLAANKTLSTTGNSLSITTDDMVLGSLSSITAGATTLLTNSAVAIGLGGTDTGGFYLTDSELGQITASSLSIGGATNGDITVDGVTSVTTPLTLIANSGASAVNFSSTASSFGDLTVDTGTGGVDFVVDVSTTGDLNVTSGGAVSFGGNVSTTNGGNLSVTSGGAITDTGALSVAGTSSFTTTAANQAITLDNTSNSFTGAVSLNTSGSSGNATLVNNSATTLSTSTVGGNLDVTSGNSLNVTGAVESIGGSITLRADDDITFTAAADLTAITGITVTADAVSSTNGSGGALTMANGTVFDAGSGTLALSADEDITLGLVKTTSSSDTAVTLTSTNGGVVDADAITLVSDFDSGASAALDIDAKNGRLVADVATGFGSANAIETQVKSVDIDNSTSGNIDIFEFDDLDVFKIDNAGGGVQVSFEGLITGKENCVAAGVCLFLRRDIRNELIEGTGKTLGQLVDSSITQLTFDAFELKSPDFLDKTPADRVSGSSNGPFTADIFIEKFDLVELAAGTDGKFDGMEVSQAFWGGTKKANLEVAERKDPDKKTRSKQRSAKRKKRVRAEADDTAAITLKKPRRILTTESGYLGLTPPTRRGVGQL